MKESRSFKIVPDNESVRGMHRDLAFRPADPAGARTLSSAEVEAFNRDGYLKGQTILGASEVLALRQYFDQLLQNALAAGQDSYSISTAHLKHGRVYDVLTDSRIVDLAADLLGDNVVAWGSHFFCKMPGDGRRVAWHQDASYWPLSPSHTVTVWLAIDDADRQNASMRFLPASHLDGHLAYRTSDTSEHNVLDQTVDDVDRYGPPVDVELKAGQVSLHSDLLLHGSEANQSDRRRCGLTLRYCAAHVRADLDWNQKGVVVRGRDDSGHWTNPPRPETP